MLLPIIYFFKKLQYCYWAASWLFLAGVVRKLVQVIKGEGGIFSLEYRLKILVFHRMLGILKGIKLFFTIACVRKQNAEVMLILFYSSC